MKLKTKPVDHTLSSYRTSRTWSGGISPAGRVTASDDVELGGSVWERFAADYWEKGATTLQNVVPGPVVDSQTLFQALITATRQYRLGVSSVRYSLWINAQEIKSLLDWLPREQDGSLEGFDRRLQQQLNGGEITILLADPHLYHETIWRRTRILLRGLYRTVGMPCGGVDTGIFLGRYRRTPFGVHRGQMSVLTLPVHGEKHFRLWQRGYGDAHVDIQDSLAYSNHVAASFELTAGRRDILYWPADYWHIGEGSGDFTAALNIGLWWDRPPLSRVLMEMSRQLTEASDAVIDQATLSYSEARSGSLSKYVASELSDALSLTRRVVSSDLIDAELKREALRWLSADGFRDVPEPLTRGAMSWEAGTVLEPSPGSRILLGDDGPESLIVAANGRLFVTSGNMRLRRPLSKLQSGGRVNAHAFTEDAPGGRELLEWLIKTRAVRITASGEGFTGKEGRRR